MNKPITTKCEKVMLNVKKYVKCEKLTLNVKNDRSAECEQNFNAKCESDRSAKCENNSTLNVKTFWSVR